VPITATSAVAATLDPRPELGHKVGTDGAAASS
jgi:hypothetical protein